LNLYINYNLFMISNFVALKKGTSFFFYNDIRISLNEMDT